MFTIQDKQLASRLIKKYAGNVSTDAMIAFVADTSGMLSVCKELVASNNRNDQQIIAWVDEECHKHTVDVRGFLYEVEQVVSIFQPELKNDNNYDVLGVEEDASSEEIRQAYRKLSRKYHPDTAESGADENGEKFVQMTKAYHALLDGDVEEPQQPFTPVSEQNWRVERKSEISGTQKKRNLLWFAAITILMVIVSLVVAVNYRNRAMIVGLQNNHSAFIPPETALLVEDLIPEEEEIKEAPKEIPIEKIQDKEPTENIEIVSSESKTERIIKDEGATQSKTIDPVSYESKDMLSPQQSSAVVKKNEPNTDHEPITISRTPKKILTAKPYKSSVAVAKKNPIVVPPKLDRTDEERKAVLQKRVEQFLLAYTESYKNKDLLAFSHFYNIHATENGKPLVETLPTYSELFQKSKTILFSIALSKWNKERRGIIADGRFHILIEYFDGSKDEGQGQISFLLNNQRNKLEILELNYRFDTQ